MANKSLVNWLLDFCDQIEGVEEIIAPDQYAQGLHDGSRITQNGIAKKLRYAAEQEKKRLTKRSPDSLKAAVHSAPCRVRKSKVTRPAKSG